MLVHQPLCRTRDKQADPWSASRDVRAARRVTQFIQTWKKMETFQVRMLLGVNIDHIATLRNVRATNYPDPMQAAFLAEQSGADCITVHLREDRRHITDHDVKMLRKCIQTRLNVEMSIADDVIRTVCETLPNSCCIVPERRQELTTEGGLDVTGQMAELGEVIPYLKKIGIRVSLFIEPDENQVEVSRRLGAQCVEIHTGNYANASDEDLRDVELDRIRRSVDHATDLGLQVHAGHGLNYSNVSKISELSGISELNIGHAIISRSVMFGMQVAVRDMKNIIEKSHRCPSSGSA